MRTCKFFPRLLLAVFRRVSANYSLSFILLAESSGTQWDPRQLYPFASTFDACVFKNVIPACIKPAIDFLPFWVCPLSNTNNKTICFLQTLATQLISSLSDIFLQTREVAVCVKILSQILGTTPLAPTTMKHSVSWVSDFCVSSDKLSSPNLGFLCTVLLPCDRFTSIPKKMVSVHIHRVSLHLSPHLI